MTDHNVFDVREPGCSPWPWRPAHRRHKGGVTAHRYTQDEAACEPTEFADPGSCAEQPHRLRSAMVRDRTRILSCGIARTVTTSDGVSLSVRDYGSRDSAHTVVLLHGLCLTKDSWTIPIDHLLRQYGDNIRIISYDHRGHGD